MRILVSCIPFDGGKSGISTYCREVVRALDAQGHDLTLLVEPETDPADILPSPARVIRAPKWTTRAPVSMLWHLLLLPLLIARRAREFDGFVICAANRRVCAWHPLPTVATIHDLANFHIPGKYSPSRMFYLARILPFFAKRATRLVAVSGATMEDMVRFWHCSPSDVTVLYNGLPQNLSAPAATTKANSPTSQSILYISRIEHPGKNHLRLVEAYGRLPRDVAKAHPLILVGADWKDADVVHKAATNSPSADFIRFLGFVPKEKMEELWANAGFYIFPSLFEGFGLSLAEAMARGIPCACSDNGSLAEIGRDAAELFDPKSADSMTSALLRLVSETPEARQERIGRGLALVKRFSWPDHARGIVRLLEEARNGTESTDN